MEEGRGATRTASLILRMTTTMPLPLSSPFSDLCAQARAGRGKVRDGA